MIVTYKLLEKVYVCVFSVDDSFLKASPDRLKLERSMYPFEDLCVYPRVTVGEIFNRGIKQCFLKPK